MDKETLEKFAELDRIVAEKAGGYYVIPYSEKAPDYDVRAIDRYCKAHNRDPSTLSDDELKMFIR
jgi:alkanesulfonate monooxygenase SsuD/methylene tetrahydromethanopterin reductase-like flavin-dependent oxidoreductase (luciferase family)